MCMHMRPSVSQCVSLSIGHSLAVLHSECSVNISLSLPHSLSLSLFFFYLALIITLIFSLSLSLCHPHSFFKDMVGIELKLMMIDKADLTATLVSRFNNPTTIILLPL